MSKTDQKLIILYGFHNSGKTCLYNLFKKESNYITLEIYKNHYHIHKSEWLELVGNENTKRIEKHILNKNVFLLDCFFEEIGLLMKQFSNYNFVVKSGHHDWLQEYRDKTKDWRDRINHFTNIKPENIKHVFAIRHPKITLATCYNHDINIDNYLERWKSAYNLLKHYDDILQIIKIEDVEIPYTEFDLNEYRLNIFDNLDKFKSDLKLIDLNLKYILDYLNYSLEDKYVDEYLKDLDRLRQKKNA